MVYISRLKLRNFKSFKAADITLPSTFTCFAGPNGSGKSNLCDAIRFVMGEKSLKSLRAKRVRELIHAGSKAAEVTVMFSSGNGGPSYEIKRAIREDGKIMYRLDGKKTTRGSILETLKRHSMDESGRNTIAQGEVARIINMNGKERRGIIDTVAGIADFEEKKKEAMRELQLVDTRIKEAQLVLGERKVYLDDLGRERETAIKYRDAKGIHVNAKGTLLETEIQRLEGELEKELVKEQALIDERKSADAELDKINAEIKEIDTRRHETSEELRAKQKTNEMIRRIEELKASVSSKEQLMEDKTALIGKIRNEVKELEDEVAEGSNAVDGLRSEVEKLAVELKEAEEKLSSEIGSVEDEKLRAIKEKIEKKEQDFSEAKERLISLSSEIESKKEILSSKKEEHESIAPGESSDSNQEDLTEIQNQVIRIAKDIENSFAKTKEINGQMADLDREMLELKEQASIFKIRSSPQLANPALHFISQLKDKEPGIYGTMADLITFNQNYASAVEAAGGARLLYVVVDSVDTASRVIDKLKRAKAGRATFIPLDKVRAPAGIKMNGFGSVLDVVEFPHEIQRAAHYVFADTLLVDDVGDAKSVGIGSARMVTHGGEIFERSGIVSGGRSQSGILSGNQLRKIENKLSEVKSTKESLLQELYSIREEESKMRAEKSQLEIQIKTSEMRTRMVEDRVKENKQMYERKERLVHEIKELEEAIQAKGIEKEQLAKEVSAKSGEVTEIKSELSNAEEEFSKQSKESSDKRAKLSGAVSSLRATIEGKKNEKQIRSDEVAEKQERMKKLGADEKDSLKKIEDARTTAEKDRKDLAEAENKISSTSKAIEKLFERLKGYESQLEEIGRRRGKSRMRLDKVSKDFTQVEIKKATTSTRLEDIKSEFSSFTEFERIEGSRDELSKMVSSSERTLASLGNVNMAAIEMYEKKRAEIDGVEERIDKLDNEREAIISMINEIDEHKKEAFFETFEAVSDNFRKMFTYVNVGEGHLYLNNPREPFESGLFIKLRRNNQEHSLDALSGGEKTLVALMFIFALQLFKPAPFYILDEVDAALDKPNSKNLADLVAKMSKDSQFILVSHNDVVMANSDSVIGVTKSGDISKLVGLRLKQVVAA